MSLTVCFFFSNLYSIKHRQMEPLVGVDAFAQQLEFIFGVRSVQRSQSTDAASSQNACKPYVTVNNNAIFLYFFFNLAAKY